MKSRFIIRTWQLFCCLLPNYANKGYGCTNAKWTVMFIFCLLFQNIPIYFQIPFIGLSIGIVLRLNSCSTLIFVNADYDDSVFTSHSL